MAFYRPRCAPPHQGLTHPLKGKGPAGGLKFRRKTIALSGFSRVNCLYAASALAARRLYRTSTKAQITASDKEPTTPTKVNSSLSFSASFSAALIAGFFLQLAGSVLPTLAVYRWLWLPVQLVQALAPAVRLYVPSGHNMHVSLYDVWLARLCSNSGAKKNCPDGQTQAARLPP